MSEDSDNPLRFTLRHMFGVTAYLGVAAAIVARTGSASLAIHLTLLLAGWIAWRFLHGHLGGLIPALVGGDVLLCTSVDWVARGAEADLFDFRSKAQVIASVLVVVGLFVLAGVGSPHRKHARHQLAIAGSLSALLVGWWIAIPTLGNAAVARRQAADTSANAAAMADAIAMVEKVLARAGTAPENGDLEALAGSPLPDTRWDELSSQIQYRKSGVATYELSFIDPSMFFGDIVVYDSAAPKKGWVRIPF